MDASGNISALYAGKYADEATRRWRAAGAVDKVDNILRATAPLLSLREARVLEIGCGDGSIAQELCNRTAFSTYLGFDLSPSGVEEATARGLPRAEFRLTQGGSIPADADCADIVVLSHVVEHLEHPRVLLYEARRLAEWVVVEVPLELNARMPMDYQIDELGHINKYSRASIRQLVQSCGFEVVDQFTTNPPHALFRNKSLPRRTEWRIKQAALRFIPAVARSLFTYHETLLLSRSA